MYDVPSVASVCDFIENIWHRARLTPQSVVICLIYVDRLEVRVRVRVRVKVRVRVTVRVRVRVRASLIYVDRLQACTARVRGVVSRL